MSEKKHEQWCASVPRSTDAIGPFRCDCEPVASPRAAMTDAGEKLAQRTQMWLITNVPTCYTSVYGVAGEGLRVIIEEAVRAELERAAGIADISGEPVIAAAIRKLKE